MLRFICSFTANHPCTFTIYGKQTSIRMDSTLYMKHLVSRVLSIWDSENIFTK